MSDLAGAWTGNTIQEGMSSTWELQLTLEDCEIGEPCGTMETVTHDWDIMDRTIECSSTLTYEGYMDDLGDATQSPFPGGFTFRETVESGICSEPMLVLTPLQDGLTLGIQEYFEDWPGWLTYGVLRLDVTA